MKNFLQYICFSLFLLISANANSAELVNAGFSFNGNKLGDNSIANRFPYSYNLYTTKDSQNKNLSILNKTLMDKLQSVSVHKIKDFASLKENITSLAFVLNSENVTISRSETTKTYRSDVIICAEALFFDFKSKKIITSYPVMVSYATLTEDKPTKAEISSIFSKIYGTESYYINGVNLNIFDQFISKINATDLSKSAGIRLGVKNVILPNATLSSLAKCGFNDPSDAKKFVATIFNSQISSKFGIPILPFSHESQLYMNLSESFMESSQLTQIVLEVPNPTYELNLNFEKLVGILNSNNRGICSFFFGAKMFISGNIKGDSSDFTSMFKNGFITAYSEEDQANWDFEAEYMRAILLLMQTITVETQTKSENEKFLQIINKAK